MTRETLIAFAVVMIPAAHGLAEDITASKIFEKVNAAYKPMDT